jgi:hypothetical protein
MPKQTKTGLGVAVFVNDSNTGNHVLLPESMCMLVCELVLRIDWQPSAVITLMQSLCRKRLAASHLLSPEPSAPIQGLVIAVIVLFMATQATVCRCQNQC